MNLLDELLVRPGAALMSALDMMLRDVSTDLKIDALISRAAHILNSPIVERTPPSNTA